MRRHFKQKSNVYSRWHNEALSHLADGHRQRIVPRFRNQIAPVECQDQFHFARCPGEGLWTEHGGNALNLAVTLKTLWPATKGHREIWIKRGYSLFPPLPQSRSSLRDFLMKLRRTERVTRIVWNFEKIVWNSVSVKKIRNHWGFSTKSRAEFC